MNFLFVDRMLDLREQESARFVKCCSLTEEFYMQHFPGAPVFPGALMIEAFVQSATLFLTASSRFEFWPIVRRLTHARFFGLVQPGDRIELDVHAAGDGKVRAIARLDGERVASASLSFDLADLSLEENQIFRGAAQAAQAFVGVLRGRLE